MIRMLENTLMLPIGNEMIILLVIAVILLFGAKKIPDFARSIGRAKGEFEGGKNEYAEEIRKAREGEETKDNDERTKLEQAATSLGVAVEGKSNEELREAMKKSL